MRGAAFRTPFGGASRRCLGVPSPRAQPLRVSASPREPPFFLPFTPPHIIPAAEAVVPAYRFRVSTRPFDTKVMTITSFWLKTAIRLLKMPISGRLAERRFSSTSLSQRSRSPG